jgi:hypothetical protein
MQGGPAVDEWEPKRWLRSRLAWESELDRLLKEDRPESRSIAGASVTARDRKKASQAGRLPEPGTAA